MFRINNYMNKKVIYTCLSGSYDNLPQPSVAYEEYDYICFSNDISEKQIGVWEIRRFPYSCEDKMRESRYVKLMPHKVLQDYSYSVYVDANLQIVGKEMEERINKLISTGVKMASVLHPDRTCLYKEAKVCVSLGRDTYWNIRRQIRYLKAEGFPENYGLYENNLIFRMHNDEKIIKISEDWWKLYCTFSRRDQLCLSYVFWKNHFKPDLFLPKGISTHNYSAIKRLSHSVPPMIKRIKTRISRDINTIMMYIFGF